MAKDKEAQFVVWNFRDSSDEEIRAILQQFYEKKVGVVFAHNINDAEKFKDIYPNISYLTDSYSMDGRITAILTSGD